MRGRVLMVSYNYPPAAPQGSARTTKLAKYLPSLGWNPTVLTVTSDRTVWGSGEPGEGEFEGVDVIHAPFPDVLTLAMGFLARLGVVEPGGHGRETRLSAEGTPGPARAVFRWAKRWAAFPDRYVLWFPFALLRGLVELRRSSYRAIYSTSPPVINHFVAAALQLLSGLPWLADYRDPWTRNEYLEFTRLQAKLAGRLEKCIMSRASVIVTVSEPLAELLEGLHPDRPHGVASITNGFDPDDYGATPGETTGPFTITYTGMLYGSQRDPTPVLGTIDELIDSGVIGEEQIVLRVYGPDTPELSGMKGGLRHPGFLQIGGVVTHKEALRRQSESDLLLILIRDSEYDAMGYGGKVFEYLGSGRQILAWNPRGGVLEGLLDDTGAGISVSDSERLKEVLEGWIEEYRRNGKLTYGGEASEIDRYSWQSLSGEMSRVLDRITGVEGRAQRYRRS